MNFAVGDRVISIEDHPQAGNHQNLPGTVVGYNGDRAIVQWDDGVSVDEWASDDLLEFEGLIMPIEGIDILKPGDDEPPKKHITKDEARDKYGVHDCIHDGEGHICGCEIGHDHEALNP